MIRKLLILGVLVAGVHARGESLPERYANYGERVVTQLTTAPFPHPQRAEGHKYGKEFFSAAEHYSDSTVAIFIPKGFHETGKIDFVIHFHGWKNAVPGVLERYKLIEQLIASHRNAILVVPQGPFQAPDSFGGKLEDPDGFKRFMADVVKTLREKSALKNKEFEVGQIILSGHSGGYEVISAIVDVGGLTNKVSEVWLFDALYARTLKFLAWADTQHGRLIDIYTPNGGTKKETEQLMADLKKRETPFYAAKEMEVQASNLRTNKLIFIYTELPHNDVLDKHKTFQEFLETSGLGKID